MIKIIPDHVNFDFIGKAKYAIPFSILLIALSFYVWFEKGNDKYGVDYMGGTEIVVKLAETGNSQTIRDALNTAGMTSATVQAFENGSHDFSIRLGGSEKDVKKHVETALRAQFSDKFSIEKTDIVGPTIGKELRSKAILAVIFGLLGIMVYVGFRFEFAFALGAVGALLHDVIVCTGIYLLCGREINASTLAAALTIIGYSVNDTIVVFDRVREEILKSKKFDLPEVVNHCINATLSRTIITHLLTFFSAVALLVYGGGAIFDLSLFMTLGIISGTYSTMYIASPIVIYWDKWAQARIEAKRAVKA